MTVKIISQSFSTKVWDHAGTELPTPGSAVKHESVARHVIDCAMHPRICKHLYLFYYYFLFNFERVFGRILGLKVACISDTLRVLNVVVLFSETEYKYLS